MAYHAAKPSLGGGGGGAPHTKYVAKTLIFWSAYRLPWRAQRVTPRGASELRRTRELHGINMGRPMQASSTFADLTEVSAVNVNCDVNGVNEVSEVSEVSGP